MKKTQPSPIPILKKLKNSEMDIRKANDGKLSGDEMKALNYLFQVKTIKRYLFLVSNIRTIR